MRIERYKAVNVKRLKELEITPQENVIVIGGRNAQGKTSALDAIMFALGGKSVMDQRPVRDGEQKAEVSLDLGEYKVRWYCTQQGYGVEVANADGAKYGSPQRILDGLVGKIAFDPLEFSRLKPKEQQATLKELVQVDFSDLEAERSDIYAERTVLNRELEQMKHRFSGTEHLDSAPDETVDTVSLAAKLTEARELEKVAHGLEREVENLSREVASTKNRIQTLEAELAQAKQKLATEEAEYGKAKAELAGLGSIPDVEALARELSEANATNELVAQKRAKNLARQEWKSKSDRSAWITNRLVEIEGEKAARLAEAPFPVQGLAFEEDGISYNGIPFDQCSSAERLRVSVAMGLAMNPKLKVMLIRDGSLLDEDSMKELSDLADAHDAQFWVERVGTGDAGAIVIEDGERVG